MSSTTIPTTHAPIAVSVPEAARLLGVSRRTIYELIAEGRLESRKLRDRRVIPMRAIERLAHGGGEVA